MKVLSVVGTPHQYIMSSPVSRALSVDHEEFLVYTDGPLSTTEKLVDDLGAPAPDVRLNPDSDTPAGQTASFLQDLDALVARESPDVVLVYGDTNATLSGALVGAECDALVAHVEGGLQSDDRNGSDEHSVLTDHCSGLLFAPSERTVDRLSSIGITDRVRNAGDVMHDALVWLRDHARDRSTVLDRIGAAPEGFVLTAVHRGGSTEDGRLQSILSGLADATHPVVVPAHPQTAGGLDRAIRTTGLPGNVEVVTTETYLDFVRLLDAADTVATDAARVQKEAFYLETPCLTFRETTPWIETVAAGRNVLVGTDPNAISRNLRRDFSPSTEREPYGGGDAAERIVDALEAAVATARQDENVESAVP